MALLDRQIRIEQKTEALRRIVGSGEMARLIRARDWAATPLGPQATWPDVLVCSVNLMLGCAFPCLIFWGPEMVQLYNDSFQPLIGEKHPLSLGQTAEESWVEAWSIIEPQLTAVLERGETVSHTRVLVPILRGGEVQDIYWDYSYSPIFEASGDVAGIMVICQDVTQERIAGERMKISEERLRMALAAAQGVGIYDWDVVNDRVYADPNFARIYGVNPAFAGEGAPIADYTRNIHPDDIAPVQEQIAATLRGEGDFSSEYRLIQPDESVKHVLAVGRCTMAENGTPLRFTGVTIDITARKETERALLESEKIAAVGRLASSIAHEINNPLEAVTNLMYLATRQPISQEARELLTTAEHELRRVSVIANQTLRFHKQASSPTEIAPEYLLATVLTMYERRLKMMGISVELDYRATQPLMCFEGDIRQVLSNLVGNAIDAMSAGGRLCLKTRTITNWKTQRKNTVFTVADTGSGISRQSIRRIFEAFFTTKGLNGNGLGLWVSKEVATRHGGRIHVRSSQDGRHHGTVFRFSLPCQR